MIRYALAIATFAVIASPASAQREFDPDRVDKSAIGSRFKIAEESVNATQMRKFQKKIVRCTVSGDRDLARELLQKSDPASIDHRELSVSYNEMMEEMNFGRCIGRAMPRSARMMRVSYKPSVMRNLMAEEIYLYDNKEPLTINEGDPEYLENRYFAGGQSYTMAEVPARLADCIVYNAPVKSHEFIDTNPTTGGEDKAAAALTDTINACLPGEGEVSLTITQLRAYVADGLWSRSYYGKMATGSVTVEGEGSE